MSLQKVLLVDLDGTLLDTNTFHKYISFIIRYYSKKKAYKTLIILFFVFSRLARIISHASLKYQLLRISKDLPDEAADSFGRSLLKYQNEDVLDILVNYNGLKILASAAPEKYTRSLGECFNFDTTLSTKCPGDDTWIENIKENKKTSSMNFLASSKQQYDLDTIVTDHHDDLPLMEVFKNVILVNPSEKTLQLTQHLKDKVRVIS